MRRLIVIGLAFSGLFGLLPAEAAPVSRECTTAETVAFPTQVTQDFDCDIFHTNAACSFNVPCLWTATARVQGIGIVGARARVECDFCPVYFEGRCGPAVGGCEAVGGPLQVKQYCVPDPRGPACGNQSQLMRVTASCDWQGIAAIQIRLTCELRGTPITT